MNDAAAPAQAVLGPLTRGGPDAGLPMERRYTAAMRVTWHDVGHIRVAALLDGDADLATSLSDAFPDLPRTAVETTPKMMPGIAGASGSWHLFSRAWLVHHPGGVLLVDTGLGGPGSPTAGWFPEPGRLPDALHEAGTTADRIDTVVISHVHDDHLSGAVTFDRDRAVPAFPRARYLIHEDDVAYLRERATEDAEDRELLDRVLEPLLASGSVDLVDGDRELGDGVTLRHAPGHTPGHQIVRVVSRGRRLTIAADAFLHPAQLGRPDHPAAADAHPAQAAASRRAILASLASNPGTVLAPTHFDRPFGMVAPGPDGLAAWRPIDDPTRRD